MIYAHDSTLYISFLVGKGKASATSSKSFDANKKQSFKEKGLSNDDGRSG